MTTILADATDPIFRVTLDFLERIDKSLPVNADAYREQVTRLFYQGDSMFGSERMWQLASYALASWIDELLVMHPWNGAEAWRNSILEKKLFNSRDCSLRFYQLAQEAACEDARDAHRIFYDCVILGFRGVYAEPEQLTLLASKLGIPKSLDEWLERNRPSIQRVTVPDCLDAISIAGAKPSNTRANIAWWSIVAMVLLAFNVLAYRIAT